MASIPTDTATQPTSTPRGLGIAHPGRIFANLPPAELTELVVHRGEAQLSDMVPLTAGRAAIPQ